GCSVPDSCGKYCCTSGTICVFIFFFFSSRRRHTRLVSDWSSDVCSSDLMDAAGKDGTIKHVMPFAYSDFRAGDLEKTYDQVGMSYLFYTNSLLGCRILAVANFKRKNFACKWAVPIPKRCVAAKRRCVPKTVIVMPRSSRGLIGANLSVKAL